VLSQWSAHPKTAEGAGKSGVRDKGMDGLRGGQVDGHASQLWDSLEVRMIVMTQEKMNEPPPT
jgi:hypothetical protein